MTETFAERWTDLFKRCTVLAQKHGCCPTNLASSIAHAEGWWDNDKYEAMLKTWLPEDLLEE